jgi:hypothetical protein
MPLGARRRPGLGAAAAPDRRDGAPSQWRTVPPSVVERLLKGAHLSRPRSTDGTGVSLGDQHEAPLRKRREPAGGSEGLVAAAARPAQPEPAGQPCHRHP